MRGAAVPTPAPPWRCGTPPPPARPCGARCAARRPSCAWTWCCPRGRRSGGGRAAPVPGRACWAPASGRWCRSGTGCGTRCTARSRPAPTPTGSCGTTSSWTWGCRPSTAPGGRPTPTSVGWPATSQVGQPRRVAAVAPTGPPPPRPHPSRRGAGAAAGPGGVPALLHLHLQQPRRPHRRHDRAPLPGLWPPALPAGRAALLRLPLPGGAGRQRRRGQAAGAGLRLPGQVRERQRAGHRRGAGRRGAAPPARRALRQGQEGAVRPAGRGDQGGRLRVPDGAGQGGGGARGHPRLAHGAAALRGRGGRALPDRPRAPGDRRLLPWAVGTLRGLGAGSPVLRRPPQGAGCGRQREAGQEGPGPGELRGRKALKGGHEALRGESQSPKGGAHGPKGGPGAAPWLSPHPLRARGAAGAEGAAGPRGAEPSWAAFACFLYYKQ